MLGKDNNLLDMLFIIWVLSLPFYQIGLIGTLSVDNILTIVVLVFFFLSGTWSKWDSKRRKGVALAIMLIVLYLLFIFLSLTTGGSFNDALLIMVPEIKIKLYFIVPLLCLVNQDQHIRALILLVVDGIVVALAAFLEAIGLLHLSFIKTHGGDRLGIEGLSRSHGLIANYGDIAVLLALCTLMLFFLLPKINIKFRIIFRTFLAMSIVVGMLAAQSRNVVFSMLIGSIAYLYFYKQLKKETVLIGWKIISFSASGLIFISLIYFFVPQVVDVVLGSKGMTASVMDRISSYKIAFDLMGNNPFLGLSTIQQIQNESFIIMIHNMWLIIALKGGILAIIPIVSLLWITLHSALKSPTYKDLVRRRHTAIVASMLIVLVVASMAYVVHYSIIFWCMFGTLTAYGSLMLRRSDTDYERERKPARKTDSIILRKKEVPRVVINRSEKNKNNS